MNPHVTLLTLAVDDLERAVAFYRDGLGFPTQGIIGTEIENGAVAFFNLQPGLKLALWPSANFWLLNRWRQVAHDLSVMAGRSGGRRPWRDSGRERERGLPRWMTPL